MSKFIQPINFKALFIFTPLLFVSIGCSETLYSQTIPSVKSSSENIDYPEIDTALGEKLQPNEEVIAHQITQVIEKSIREQYTAEMLCVMHTLKRMDVFVLNFMYLKIYQLNFQKVFLFQIKL